MKFNIGSLLEMPSLGCTLASGASGTGRWVAWAHVCELEEPWTWIGSDALIMTTGLGIPKGAAEQVAYIEGLDEYGIAGVAIGENMSAPDLTPEMLAKSDELGVPVIWVKREVPYITMARAVAAANLRTEQERLARTERIYEVMRTNLVGTSEREFLAMLSLQLDADLSIVRTDRPVDPASSAAIEPEEQQAVIDLVKGSAQERVAFLRLDQHRFVVPLSTSTGTALVLRPLEDAPIDVGLAQHAAAVVTARLSIEDAEFSREGRLASVLLHRLLDAEIDAISAIDALRIRELEPSYRLYVWRQTSVNDLGQHARASLAHARIPNLMTTRDDFVVVLASDGEEPQGVLERALAVDNWVGVSGPFTEPGEVLSAFRQSKWAASRASDVRQRTVRFEDEQSRSIFMPTARGELENVVEKVLGKLIDYDRAKNSQLLLTLRVFLEENRSWMRAAARLHVNKQTLVYRVDRIEEITNRKLSSMADAAELWMAIQSALAIGVQGNDLDSLTLETNSA